MPKKSRKLLTTESFDDIAQEVDAVPNTTTSSVSEVPGEERQVPDKPSKPPTTTGDKSQNPLMEYVLGKVGEVTTDSSKPSTTKDKSQNPIIKYVLRKVGEFTTESIFSNPVYRRITTIGMCIAGAAFGPLIWPALGITSVPVSLACVGGAIMGGIAGDTMRIRNMRQLTKEKITLGKYARATAEKQTLIKAKPELSKWLEEELTTSTFRSPNVIIRAFSAVKDIIKDNAPAHLSHIESKIPLDKINVWGIDLSLNPDNKKVKEIKKNKNEITDLSKEYRNELTEARKEVGYSNVSQLEQKAHEERINVLAFKEVAKRKNITNAQDAKLAFKAAVKKIEAKELAIQQSHGVVRYAKTMFQDFVEAHSVDSGHNIPEKVKNMVGPPLSKSNEHDTTPKVADKKIDGLATHIKDKVATAQEVKVEARAIPEQTVGVGKTHRKKPKPGGRKVNRF